MIDAAALKARGTSPAAIARHYDLSDDFFRSWLGPELVYSCAWWSDDKDEDLQRAQRRKLDFFAARLGVRDGRVLDIGCGWGGLLDRFARAGGASETVGLTLSPSQVAFASDRRIPGASFRLEHWADHQPAAAYDAIACIEATEHFASDAADADGKVEIYRAFFERCASWLRDGGRVGLQLICLDAVGHAGSRPGRGPLSELIRTVIFPESMPASLGEMVLGWETHFRLIEFLEHSDHYVRTFRAWRAAARADPRLIHESIGPEAARAFEKYFAVGDLVFRMRDHALYRVILEKRPAPKKWAVHVWPRDIPTGIRHPAAGASTAALRSHYDVSNEFYRLWLGRTMMYSSGRWTAAFRDTGLDDAVDRKIDFWAAATRAHGVGRVLDVGCGWGHVLRRLADHHAVGRVTGLTPSPAQWSHAAALDSPRVEARLERWEEHQPDGPYDVIVSFGAFEHFAPDGSSGPARIVAYRSFFQQCHEWLVPGGRVALETIAHDDAPDTDQPLGRGPLGDAVLGVYPESLCPHLSELVLGFEPWFEVELLEARADDFALTMRSWARNLRGNWDAAVALVGADTVRRYWRYLIASEMQFRTGAITNYGVVLHRRAAPRW